MQFVRAAETTNSEDLVLPILFSDIKGTRTAVVDTVAARAEDLQWEDFTVLRHSSDDDADYRHAISSMAARIRGVLAKIDDAAEVAARSARETEPQNNEAEGPGVADLIAIAEVQVEDLGVFLELLAEYLQKISSEFEEATSLLTDAQSFAKRVRIYRRLAADISDDVEAMCEASDAFASSVIAAAPGVDAILEMLEADDSQSPESLTLASDIVTLAREMLQGFDHASTFQAQLTPLVGQSRDMRPQVVKMSDAVSRMLSVRPTFEHWLTRAADLSTKYAHGSGVD